MNNLKELNPVPNGIRKSSEGPPGFIYPAYRAAGTAAQRDKRPLYTSHQGVAYVFSSVGGSLSTLSFEDVEKTLVEDETIVFRSGTHT